MCNESEVVLKMDVGDDRVCFRSWFKMELAPRPRPTRCVLARTSSAARGAQPRWAGPSFHSLAWGASLASAALSRCRRSPRASRCKLLVAPTQATADELVRYCGGNVVVRALCATELVRQVVSQHDCSPMAGIALGRAVLATVLLANGRDEGERLQLRIQGEGPIGSIITEASSALTCRGMVGAPKASAATVPELLGGGTLRLTRTHPYWKRPYTGTIGLTSGEIAEDVVQYLTKSEQTPASMGLSVELDEEGQIKEAEGWLVTLLPGLDPRNLLYN